MPVESTAEVLTERIDALAAALRAAGIPPERSAGLLASAAAATMQALTLDALVEGQPPRTSRREPAAVGHAATRAVRVPLAA